MGKGKKAYHFVKDLPQTIHHISQRLDKVERNQAELVKSLQDLQGSISDANKQLANIWQKIADLKHDFTPTASIVPARASNLQAYNHALDSFYLAFEEKFRGSAEEIYKRLSLSYLPHLKSLSPSLKKLPVVDIGCGRGEMLKLYKTAKLKPFGIDLNKSMVEACVKNGYNAEQIDALSYLKNLKSKSTAAVSAIHLAEHMPFEDLAELIGEIFRTLSPGGLLIIETPNPENLTVGAFTFWYDTSHLKPVPPDVLEFAVKFIGFSDVQVKRMRADKEKFGQIKDKDLQEVAKRVLGPRDYAVIARKPGVVK